MTIAVKNPGQLPGDFGQPIDDNGDTASRANAAVSGSGLDASASQQFANDGDIVGSVWDQLDRDSVKSASESTGALLARPSDDPLLGTSGVGSAFTGIGNSDAVGASDIAAAIRIVAVSLAGPTSGPFAMMSQGQFLIPTSLSAADGNLQFLPVHDIFMQGGVRDAGSAGLASMLTDINPGAPVQFTGNQNVDAVLFGSKWNITNLTFSFPTSGTNYTGTSNKNHEADAGNFVAFTAIQQAGVRYALGLISQFTGLTFTEVAETNSSHANLRFSNTHASSVPSAYGNFPGVTDFAGDIWFGLTGQPFYNAPGIGNWGMATIMHEIGHTMGRGCVETPRCGMLP